MKNINQLGVMIVLGCLIIGGSLIFIQNNKANSIERQKQIELRTDECESLTDGIRDTWSNVMGVRYDKTLDECTVIYKDSDGKLMESLLKNMQTVKGGRIKKESLLKNY